MLDELPLRFVREHGERENIQIIFLGGARIFKAQEAMGVAVESCPPVGCIHWAIIPFEFKNAVLTTTAHELGHTCGLPHNEQGNAIMRERGQEFGLPQTLARYFIDAQEAEILSKHPFFHDIPVIEEPVKPPDLSLSVSGIARKKRLWGK
jgi:hypothetical protein